MDDREHLELWYASEILSDPAYRILLATSIEEALAIMNKEEQIDLAVLSLEFPAGEGIDPKDLHYWPLNGYYVARKFRDKFPDKPILIQEGDPDKYLPDRVKKIGFAGKFWFGDPGRQFQEKVEVILGGRGEDKKRKVGS